MSLPFELAAQIKKNLLANPEKVVFEDSFGSMKGQKILDTIDSLIKCLSEKTPVGSRVILQLENGCGLAVSLLAVLFSGHSSLLIHSDLKINSHEGWGLGAVISEDITTHQVPHIIINSQGKVLKVIDLVNDIFTDTTDREETLVLFTSGSTGAPKGVRISDNNLIFISDLVIQRLGLNEFDSTAILLPMSHVMGLLTQFFPALLSGGKITFLNSLNSLGQMMKTLNEAKATTVTLISSMIRPCVSEVKLGKVRPNTNVREVQVSGGVILEQHIRDLKELFPNANIHRAYGMTEAVRIATVDSSQTEFDTDCVGLVSPLVEVQVRSDDNKIVADGNGGTIFARGPNVALGYLNSDPFPKDAEGFYNTGDLGYLEDHKLFVLGRADGVFKLHGKKISTQELENIFTKDSRILEAKCMAYEINKELRPVLFLMVPNGNADESTAGYLADFIKNELDTIKRPRKIILMTGFPRTKSGKPDGERLLKMLELTASPALKVIYLGGIEFYLA